MSRSAGTLGMVALLTLVTPARAQTADAAQPPAEDELSFVSDGLHPFVAGGVAGAGLALVLLDSRAPVVPASGEVTASVSIVSGIALAFVSRITARTRYPGSLRATLGSSTAHQWEYALAYRTRVAKQLSIEAAFLVGNHSVIQSESQEQCYWIFGCYTNGRIVDYEHKQMGAMMARAVFEPFPASWARPSFSVGAGPSHARAEYLNFGPEQRTGGLFDVMISVQPAWLTADLGVRSGTLRTRSAVDTAWYLRLGYVFGGP